MVNGVNSVVNMKELMEQKVILPPVIFKEESNVNYIPKFHYFWRRKKLGTYPKWLAVSARKILRFCFKHLSKYNIEIVLRGRGSRVKAAKVDNVNACCYHQDLPLRHSKRVAVYVSILRRQR